MTSTPVYTSTADGYRDAKEIAALRPVAPAKPRAPRKRSAPISVSTGIVCFCGERFSEAQSLEFMKHLRAEYGEVLEWRERTLTRGREAHRTRYADAEYRERANARRRERWASDPSLLEKQRASRKPITPEQRDRHNARGRERRARQKAEREAQDTPGQAN
jgi:hypothetical protein